MDNITELRLLQAVILETYKCKKYLGGFTIRFDWNELGMLYSFQLFGKEDEVYRIIFSETDIMNWIDRIDYLVSSRIQLALIKMGVLDDKNA